MLLTIADAAKTLAISTRSVERLLATGELPVVRLGRSTRVAVADVEALIASRRSSTGNLAHAVAAYAEAAAARRSPPGWVNRRR